MAPVRHVGAVPIVVFRLIDEGKVPIFGKTIEVNGFPKV